MIRHHNSTAESKAKQPAKQKCKTALFLFCCCFCCCCFCLAVCLSTLHSLLTPFFVFSLHTQLTRSSHTRSSNPLLHTQLTHSSHTALSLSLIHTPTLEPRMERSEAVVDNGDPVMHTVDLPPPSSSLSTSRVLKSSLSTSTSSTGSLASSSASSSLNSSTASRANKRFNNIFKKIKHGFRLNRSKAKQAFRAHQVSLEAMKTGLLRMQLTSPLNSPLGFYFRFISFLPLPHTHTHTHTHTCTHPHTHT